jgi:hypothetical protein
MISILIHDGDNYALLAMLSHLVPLALLTLRSQFAWSLICHFPGSFLLSIFPITKTPSLIITSSSSTIRMNTQAPSNTSQAFPSNHNPDPTQDPLQAEPNQNKQTTTSQPQACPFKNQPISNQPSRLRGGENGGTMTVLGWIVCL